ncbi:glycosyltransferase family 4 protein [Oscillatoria sp. FACHB-1407]|uniref:glycosyltransferase family 4 protein n=1 Tax=Oscillatoria sp. FACHB-1407 TaxID=2692847 RepID=UPI0016875F17|nr:glycosyltransferase family 4 protein [Oscillatoria sp. FACHB-1407]MBD2459592.1 glycosyltransferase family 4 protein [Oscillatoria sp. FACHB-1407]
MSHSESHPSTQSRYVFVFLEIFSSEGGIQSYVKDVLQGYTALKHQPPVDVFLLRDSQDCDNPFESSPIFQFHYLRGKSAKLDRIRLAIALFLHLLKHRPQQVFCGHVKLAPLVQMLCQPSGIPYTVFTYGKEVWAPLPSATRRALQQAKAIWTISRYSRDQACVANQLDPQLFRVMPCMVDGDRFTPGTKSEGWIAKYGLAGATVLMTVARLWSGDAYKGVDVTIQALPAIAQVFPKVKYLIIGRGDDQPRLAKLAADLGVSDRVVFAGFVATDDLVEHYRLADVYVMPSQEGFGIVYLEAMACGKPVLAGDADGSAEPLQDGKLGWRVPRRDPDAVAQACIEILQELSTAAVADPSDQTNPCRSNGIWLRQQAIASFGRDAFMNQLKQLFMS